MFWTSILGGEKKHYFPNSCRCQDYYFSNNRYNDGSKHYWLMSLRKTTPNFQMRPYGQPRDEVNSRGHRFPTIIPSLLAITCHSSALSSSWQLLRWSMPLRWNRWSITAPRNFRHRPLYLQLHYPVSLWPLLWPSELYFTPNRISLRWSPLKPFEGCFTYRPTIVLFICICNLIQLCIFVFTDSMRWRRIQRGSCQRVSGWFSW